jgi:two-component system OmpR family sensor kinase
MSVDMPAITSRGVNRRLPPREAVDRQVTEFCHDLRQPSAALSLLAMAAIDPGLPERTQERLTQIAREVGRLSSMVHSVLAGLPVWEPVELGEVARAVVDSSLITYDGEITLVVHDRAHVLGQRVQLDRALSNLVENAAHASGGAGHVHVEVARDGDRAQLIVEDDGPGLIRAAGGVSLGLLIVDRVTREHSGDVVVSDSGLGGTRIEMRFPLIEADRPTVEM